VELKREEFARFFDRYNRVARLYPALLTIAPLIWTVALLHPGVMTGTAVRTVASSAMIFGGLYFLSSIARWRGKAVEGKLLDSWGGWPTTLLLRHRDDTIDRFTKGRYHTALERACDGLSLPSAEEETRDPFQSRRDLPISD
jgi:hypothetical protein